MINSLIFNTVFILFMYKIYYKSEITFNLNCKI